MNQLLAYNLPKRVTINKDFVEIFSKILQDKNNFNNNIKSVSFDEFN